jgi:hypothetical protein
VQGRQRPAQAVAPCTQLPCARSSCAETYQAHYKVSHRPMTPHPTKQPPLNTHQATFKTHKTGVRRTIEDSCSRSRLALPHCCCHCKACTHAHTNMIPKPPGAHATHESSGPHTRTHTPGANDQRQRQFKGTTRDQPPSSTQLKQSHPCTPQPSPHQKPLRQALFCTKPAAAPALHGQLPLFHSTSHNHLPDHTVAHSVHMPSLCRAADSCSSEACALSAV